MECNIQKYPGCMGGQVGALLSMLSRAGKLVLLAYIIFLSGCNQDKNESEADFQAAQVEKLATDNAQAFSLFNNGQIDFLIEVALEDYSAVVSGVPKNGRVLGQIQGRSLQLRYVPNEGFIGQDFLIFKITNDETAIEATGKVQFVVLNPNLEGQDSDMDGLSDEEEISIYLTDPSLKDTDRDGLSDGAEVLSYKTSPVMPDTDGDSLTDWYEIVNLAFDSELDNYNFNPLIADVPEIALKLVTAPNIDLIQEDSQGNTTTVTTERSATEARGIEISNSDTQSTAVETNSTSGWNVGGEGGASDGKVLAVVSGGYSKSKSTTTTKESSYTWSSTESQENSQTYSRAKSLEATRNLTTSGGILSLATRITNRGNMPFTVKNIFLSASQIDKQGNIESSFGNLSFDTNNNHFPEFSLSRGISSGVMAFSAPLPLGLANALLRNSEQVSVGVATVELVDSEGKAFAFNEIDLFNKNATVEIDFGGRKSLQKYRVAVVANPSELTKSLTDVLNEILIIPSEIESGRLVAVGGVGDNDQVCPGRMIGNEVDCSEPLIYSNYWVVLHSREQAGQVFTTVYDNNFSEDTVQLPEQLTFKALNQETFSKIKLQAGDLVRLIYVEDKDQDGVGIRQEFAFGSSPMDPDTDKDGLTDRDEIIGWDIKVFEDDDGCSEVLVADSQCAPGSKKFEARRVFSSPVDQDTDFDGVNDFDECKRNKFDASESISSLNSMIAPEKCKIAEADNRYPTDSSQKDTDLDGVPDIADAQPVIFNDLVPVVKNFKKEDIGVKANIVLPSIAMANVGVSNNDYKVLIVSKKVLSGQQNIVPETNRFPAFSDDLIGKLLQCEKGEVESACWRVENIIDFGDNISDYLFSSNNLSEETNEGERIDFHAIAWVNGYWIEKTSSFSYSDVPIYRLELSVNSIKNLKCGDSDNYCDMLFIFSYNGRDTGVLNEREIEEGYTTHASFNFSKDVFASNNQCLDLNYYFAEIDSGPDYSPRNTLKFCYSESVGNCAFSGSDGSWSKPEEGSSRVQSCTLTTPIYRLHGEDTQYSFNYNFTVKKKAD